MRKLLSGFCGYLKSKSVSMQIRSDPIYITQYTVFLYQAFLQILLMLILHLFFFLWSKQKCDPLESCPLICLDLMSPHSSHLSLRVLRWHVTDSPIKMISQLLHSLLSVLSTLDGENQWDCGHGGSGDLKCVSHTRDRLSSFPWA